MNQAARYSKAWREDHIMRGEAYLKQADDAASSEHGMPNMELFAMTTAAQAHFAAAALAEPTPREIRTKVGYTLPGVEGVWEPFGMETTGMGVTGNVVLTLRRVDR